MRSLPFRSSTVRVFRLYSLCAVMLAPAFECSAYTLSGGTLDEEGTLTTTAKVATLRSGILSLSNLTLNAGASLSVEGSGSLQLNSLLMNGGSLLIKSKSDQRVFNLTISSGCTFNATGPSGDNEFKVGNNLELLPDSTLNVNSYGGEFVFTNIVGSGGLINIMPGGVLNGDRNDRDYGAPISGHTIRLKGGTIKDADISPEAVLNLGAPSASSVATVTLDDVRSLGTTNLLQPVNLAVTFEKEDGVTYSRLALLNEITGRFSLTKSGIGSLAVAKPSPDFSGDIVVTGGTLLMADPLNGGRTVNVGARGTMSAALSSSAVFPGTLSVQGRLNLTSESLLSTISSSRSFETDPGEPVTVTLGKKTNLAGNIQVGTNVTLILESGARVSGALDVSRGGKLVIASGAGSVFSASAVLTVNSGAVVDLNGVNQTVGKLKVLNGGAVVSSSGAAKITYEKGAKTLAASGENVDPALVSQFLNRADTPGTYDGLLTPTESASSELEQSGLVSVTITASGSFSGKLQMLNKQQSFKGKFSEEGRALFGTAQTERYAVQGSSSSSKTSIGNFVMRLELRDDHPVINAQLLGPVDGEAVLSEGVAERTVYSSLKTLPVEMKRVPTEIYDSSFEKGVYTVLMDIPEELRAKIDEASGSELYPQGSGYGKITVSPNGTVAFAGKLSDGTSVTYSNRLSGSNGCPLYVPLYSKKGSLAGKVLFDPSAEANDAAGQLMRWFKPTGSKGSPYLKGWIEGVNLELQASKYVQPSRPTKNNPYPGTVFGREVLGVQAPSVNLSVLASGGWLSGATPYEASMSAASVVTAVGAAAKDKLKVNFTSTSGAFTGSVTHPETKKTVKFDGVVFQKTQSARGNFSSPSLNSEEPPKIGAISITISE